MSVLAPADLRAIKSAGKNLVGQVGGFAAAEALLGYPAGHLSTALSLQHMQGAPRVDHILALELHAEAPLVTRVLVAAHRSAMAPLPAPAASREHALGLVMREMGELLELHGAALADGVVQPAERAAMRVQAGELARRLASFQAALAADP
jgi:hypothetical protein